MDLGKVVFDYNHERIFSALDLDLKTAVEIKRRLFSSGVVAKYQIGRLSTPNFIEYINSTFDLSMNRDEFYRAWNSTFSPLPILPVSLIETLSKKYQLIALSDTNEIHIDFLKNNFRLLEFFDDLVLSHEVGFAKPSREIFEIATKRAKCNPKECLFTDDRKENVEGAILYGLNAMLFENPEKFELDLKRLKII